MAEYEESLSNWWKESDNLAIALIVAALSAVVWVEFTNPSPGISIGMLALAAGVMSLRPDMRLHEKAAWMVVLGALAVLEVRAIHRTDQENKDNLDNQIARFNGIADELTKNYQFNREKFGDTLAEMSTVLSKSRAAADAAGEGVRNLTGDDSYAYYKVRPAKGTKPYEGDELPNLKDKVLFYAKLAHIGKYPIPFMNVTRFCPGQTQISPQITVGPITPGSVANSQEFILSFPQKNVENMGDSCQILMEAPNGTLAERIYPVKLKDDTWSWAMSLQRDSPHYFWKHVLGPGVPNDFKFPREIPYSQSVGKDAP